MLYIAWIHIMECKKEKNSTKTWFLQLGKNPKKLALFFPLLFHIKKIFFISTKKMAKIFVISWIFDFFRNPNNPAFLHQLHLSFSQVLFWHFHHIFSIRRKKNETIFPKKNPSNKNLSNFWPSLFFDFLLIPSPLIFVMFVSFKSVQL